MTFVYRSRNSQFSFKIKDQLQRRWVWTVANDHYKKSLAVFPAPAGMSLTKLSLAGNKLIIPSQGVFGNWRSGLGRENC